MSVRRSDVRCRGMHEISLFRLFDLEWSTPAEYVSHQTAMSGIEVLHDHNGGRKVSRKSGQHFAQRLEAARRGGKRYDVKGATKAP